MAKKMKKPKKIKRAVKKKRRPKTVSRTGFGIVHQNSGEFWSRDLYVTPEAAKSSWSNFWQLPGFTTKPPWSNYRVVKVRQALTHVSDIH